MCDVPHICDPLHPAPEAYNSGILAEAPCQGRDVAPLTSEQEEATQRLAGHMAMGVERMRSIVLLSHNPHSLEAEQLTTIAVQIARTSMDIKQICGVIDALEQLKIMPALVERLTLIFIERTEPSILP